MAAGEAGLAYASAALAVQRRMGIAEPDRSVLTTDMAAELVRGTELPDGQDAAALGAMLRDQFGEHWRVALADLERAGLSEQVAIIAALDRPGQQPAARQLSEAVGTPTSELREAAGDSAKFIDQLLGITLGGSQATPDLQGVDAYTSRGELVRRRAYALAAEGWAPGRAVQRAIEDLSAATVPEAAGSDGRSLAALAETQGIHPSVLGEGGAAVESILESFTRFGDLTDNQRMVLREDIQKLRGGHQAYPALRDRFVDLENAVGLFDPPELTAVPEPAVSPFEAFFEDFIAAGGVAGVDGRPDPFVGLKRELFLARRQTGDVNRLWIDDAMSGTDVQRMEFAALFLADIGGTGGIQLQDILSVPAQENYIAFWNERFALADRIEFGPRRPADARLASVARSAPDIANWVLPTDMVGDLLLEISRSSAATDSQRRALIDHIDRVVTPFSAGVGAHLRQAVGALDVGKDENGNDDFGEVPARFAYLLSHEHFVGAALSRGIVIPDRSNPRAPAPPPNLLDDPNFIINASGAGFGAVGFGAALLAGATPAGWVLAGGGALVAGVGLKGSIDDNDDAHTRYLIQKEFYDRFQDSTVREDLTAYLDSPDREFDPGEDGEDSDGDGDDSDDSRNTPAHTLLQ